MICRPPSSSSKMMMMISQQWINLCCYAAIQTKTNCYRLMTCQERVDMRGQSRSAMLMYDESHITQKGLFRDLQARSPSKRLPFRHEVAVTYSTDVTCLSWVWRESSILWGVEGGTSGGGAVLYIYGDPVWRSLGGEAEERAEEKLEES